MLDSGRAKVIWPDWFQCGPDCPIGPDWKRQSGIPSCARLVANLALFLQSGFRVNLALALFFGQGPIVDEFPKVYQDTRSEELPDLPD